MNSAWDTKYFLFVLLSTIIYRIKMLFFNHIHVDFLFFTRTFTMSSFILAWDRRVQHIILGRCFWFETNLKFPSFNRAVYRNYLYHVGWCHFFRLSIDLGTKKKKQLVGLHLIKFSLTALTNSNKNSIKRKGESDICSRKTPIRCIFSFIRSPIWLSMHRNWSLATE